MEISLYVHVDEQASFYKIWMKNDNWDLDRLLEFFGAEVEARERATSRSNTNSSNSKSIVTHIVTINQNPNDDHYHLLKLCKLEVPWLNHSCTVCTYCQGWPTFAQRYSRMSTPVKNACKNANMLQLL